MSEERCPLCGDRLTRFNDPEDRGACVRYPDCGPSNDPRDNEP